ncbi:MAG TPA: hypothetical protein VMH05_00125 [Bryobacteraceae bacterium]|nr:hypothetical protein [Bryobacteraceae bacterium]
MTDFEDQLRRALERKDPSPDFAARVLAQVSVKRRPRAIADWFHWPAWTAAAIAASLLLASTGLDLERRQRLVRAQGEQARAQLIQAMEITSAQLNKIHKKVQGAIR